MIRRCLYCYQPLPEVAKDFHPACSKKFFGTETVPELSLTMEKMEELAKDIVLRSVAVTGVQPKLSLTIDKQPEDPKKSRFTIVGLWGSYILKPPSKEFPHLPENEDLTMHLAALFGINSAQHSLVRLQSGELAYITKRFDRNAEGKLALEDMCQLTETLTADKYRSSMEKIGKAIWAYASRPGLAAISFFELTLFSFITGNADMHLKNFSLLTDREGEIMFAPAYDLLCTKLAIPDDKEETALTLNGRKSRFKKTDFDALGKSLKIPSRSIENSYTRLGKCVPLAEDWINISFLPDEQKEKYWEIIQQNSKRLGL